MQFNLRDALAGVMVGFRNNSDSTDISATGVLREPGPNYSLEFNGYRMLVDHDGNVLRCRPEKYTGQKLQMVTTSMDDEMEAGTAAKGRRRANAQGQYVTDDNINLTSLQPRDHFALHVLNAMLIHAGQLYEVCQCSIPFRTGDDDCCSRHKIRTEHRAEQHDSGRQDRGPGEQH